MKKKIKRKTHKKKLVCLSTTSILLLILITSSFLYLNNYYKSSSNINKYLETTASINITKEDNGIYFNGPGEENILVFYPGAKVEYTAYAKLMYLLANEGIDTYLVKMPFNIAFFKINAIEKVMKDYKYDNWYIGGHSLGGVVASYNIDNEEIKGLILLASYPTKEIDKKVLSIYGDKDGVLNTKKYKENIKKASNLTEIVIEGANHANFGNYGNQKGDLEAIISRGKQQEQTKEEILKFIKK